MTLSINTRIASSLIILLFPLLTSTTMSTETETQQPSAPEITIIQRVTSIPIIADSIGVVDSTLSSNAYTQTSYAYAKGLSQTALSYAAPLQKTLSPLLACADGYANKGLDVVESRYPYPFKTPTEDIVKDLRGRSDAAKEVANKTLDERVKNPAYNVAQGIDQVCFSPCFISPVCKWTSRMTTNAFRAVACLRIAYKVSLCELLLSATPNKIFVLRVQTIPFYA